MEEISRPTKTMRSSTEQVMSIMPTAPKQSEGEVLAGVGGVAFKVVERAEEGDEDNGADDVVEEDGEGVDLDGVRRRRGACRSESWYQLARASGDGAGMAIQPRGLRLEPRAEAGLGQHDEDAGEGEDEFGQEGEDVRGHYFVASVRGISVGFV